jgi:hypothetical protein
VQPFLLRNIRYNNILYQIQVKTPSYAMRGASVQVCERKGKVSLLYKGRELSYTTIDKQNKTQEVVSSKDIDQCFDRRTLGNKPRDAHPWKTNYPERRGAVKKEHLSTASSRQPDSSLSPASQVYG